MTDTTPGVVLLATIYAVMSVVTFVVYAADKSAARQGRRRVSESTLHALSIIGGWPGALLGQQVLRHKTRKQPFRTVFWVTVVVNCALVAGVLALAQGLGR